MKVEKENAWRSLQGLKPIQSLKCRLGWHRWTSYEYLDHDFNMGRVNDYARCHCADCGFPRIEYPYSKTLYRKKNAN